VLLDRDDVSASSGTREGRGRSEADDIVEGPLRERQEDLEWQPDGRGNALNLAEERDEVVGRDTGSGVVPGSQLRRDLQHAASQRHNEIRDSSVPGNREIASGEQALGPDNGVRKGYKRVERSDALMGRQHLETERSRAMNYDCGRHGPDGGGDAGDDPVGDSEQQHVDTDRGR
jgi:hypothetical protein